MAGRLRPVPLKSPAAPRVREAAAAPPLRAALLSPREPYLAPLVAALALRLWMTATIPFAAEDAYITFRYAEHWAHGLVHDEVGLVSPQVARRRAQGPGWYADTVARLRPDWLVVRDGFFAQNRSFAGVAAPVRSAEEMAAVRAQYDMVPVSVGGQDTGLTILKRRR